MESQIQSKAPIDSEKINFSNGLKWVQQKTVAPILFLLSAIDKYSVNSGVNDMTGFLATIGAGVAYISSLLGGFLTNWLVWLVIGLGTSVVGGGFYYYSHTQAQLQSLAAEVAKNQVAIQIQQDTITSLQALAEDQKANTEHLQSSTAVAETSSAALASTVQNLHITTAAKTNRPALQTKLNNDLDNLFSTVKDLSNAKNSQ